MTLHCNKVKLWPCPEWVAKMCMHEIWHPVVNPSENDKYFDRALERYLMWAKTELPILLKNGHRSDGQQVLDTLEKEVQAVMNDPDLKVWIE